MLCFWSSKVLSISRAAVEWLQSRNSTRRSSLCVLIIIPATATGAIFVFLSLNPARPQGHQLITCTWDIVLGRSTARVFLFKCSPAARNLTCKSPRYFTSSAASSKSLSTASLSAASLSAASYRLQEGNVHDEQCHNFVRCVRCFELKVGCKIFFGGLAMANLLVIKLAG